jgi:beta-xylosidase
LRAQDSANIFLADPAIFLHKGTYYLYGTVEGRVDEGFQVYTSTDRRQWNLAGYALKKGEAFGTKGFWAPQVFQHKDTFYMAYVANEEIAIATSMHPQGPFRQAVLQPLAAPVKQIDPFVFMDSDGKKYLYHVRLANGNKIFVAEMTDDLRGIKPATLQECITATDKWENTANAEWPVTEGPSVFKHRGLYYLVYTANDFRNPDYAVGYATSKSPMGPWQKHSGNPVLNKGMVGQNGPGHGDFFKDGKDQLFYVFHTHFSPQRVGPRKTAMVRAVMHKNVLLLAPATLQYLVR